MDNSRQISYEVLAIYNSMSEVTRSRKEIQEEVNMYLAFMEVENKSYEYDNWE